MAIVSRRSQLQFNPRPDGDDFESRINRIITPATSSGVDPDFLASTRPQTRSSILSDRHPPVNRVNLYSRVDHFSRTGTAASSGTRPGTGGRPKSGQKSVAGGETSQNAAYEKKMREKYAEELDKYYYWVDDQGNPLQPIPAVEPEPESHDLASRAATPDDVCRERAEKAKRRSQKIWGKVNPGYVKVLYNTPTTTYQEKHKWDDANDFVHKEKDWSNHLCKTDFSGFIEEDARQTQFAKSQAGR